MCVKTDPSRKPAHKNRPCVFSNVGRVLAGACERARANKKASRCVRARGRRVGNIDQELGSPT